MILLRVFDNLHRTTLCRFFYFILIIRKVYPFNYNCHVFKFKNFRTNIFAQTTCGATFFYPNFFYSHDFLFYYYF